MIALSAVITYESERKMPKSYNAIAESSATESVIFFKQERQAFH